MAQRRGLRHIVGGTDGNIPLLTSFTIADQLQRIANHWIEERSDERDSRIRSYPLSVPHNYLMLYPRDTTATFASVIPQRTCALRAHALRALKPWQAASKKNISWKIVMDLKIRP